MTTLLTTFEHQLREGLLDVVFAQWHDLGVPLATALPPSEEVIDPEALLWCSLEFLPTEPRLREGVLAWLAASDYHLIRQRVNKHARQGDPRDGLWHALSGRSAPRSGPEKPTEPSHGLESAEQVSAFCAKLIADRARPNVGAKEAGRPVTQASTALLRARDLLGSDIRHFLLVYLLANPEGGRLKIVQRWTGYSYQSISQTAARWEAAGVLTLDRGYCHLTDPGPWQTLLPLGVSRAVVVDWFAVFGTCVRLLRVLAKAGRKGLTVDSPVVQSHCRQADEALAAAVLGAPHRRGAGVGQLRGWIRSAVGRPTTCSTVRPVG